MPDRSKKIEKPFDAVAFMRQQRDRISKDIMDMDFEEIKTYFSKGRKTGKSTSRKKAHA